MQNKVAAAVGDSSVGINGFLSIKEKKGEVNPNNLIGFIKFKITQREFTSDGKKTRKLETIFGNSKANMEVYESFVEQATGRRKQAVNKEVNKKQAILPPKDPKFGQDKNFTNPLDDELKQNSENFQEDSKEE